MKNIVIVLILLMSGIGDICNAQYTFRPIDIPDGLSDNQIRDFTLLPDGRLAVQTMTALNIYNGATFEQAYQDKSEHYFWNYNRFLRERYSYKNYVDAQKRLWCKAPDYLSLYDSENNTFIYNIDDVLRNFGIHEKLKNIFIDNDKNYWFLTEDNTFSFYDSKIKKLRIIEKPDEQLTNKQGVPYEMTQYKNLHWIIYSSGLLRCWDSSSQEFVRTDNYFTYKFSDASNFLSFRPTTNGDLWLMYNNGIFFYNRNEGRWTEIASISGVSNFFTCMDLDVEGNVWVGTSWSGLRRIDAKTQAVESIAGLKLDSGGTMNNDIQCVFVDTDGGLWVGTLWQGICYYNTNRQKFKLVQTKNTATHITNESIRCFLEEADGSILLGTLYDGVLKYNPQTETITKAFQGIVPEGLILSLYRDRKNRLWIGTFLNGFYCIDGKSVKNYNRNKISVNDFTNQNISRAVFEDANGHFWISVANQGVGELNLQTGKIVMLRENHPEIAFQRKIFGFFPLDNNVFAAFGENGIYFYDTKNDKIHIPSGNGNDKMNFASPYIVYYCIVRDSKNRIWCGTEQGIRIWDEKAQHVYTIDKRNNLPNDNIFAILEDARGAFWASSANGIAKIEINDNAGKNEDFVTLLVNFDSHDGLQDGKFFEGSALETTNGNIFFGGYNGFNVFNPSKIQYNESKKVPIFTALKLFNNLVNEKTEFRGHKILEKPVNNTQTVQLRYNENFITLEFSGLNYVSPSHTYYRYKLDNYDQNWNEISTNGLGTATYTGLKAGKYRFMVYSAGSDKIWGDRFASLEIIISPPWWINIYAKSIYFLLLVAFLYFLYNYFERKNKIKIARRRQDEQQRQREELDQMKFRFFTNISHEFRTPLTLIMTPLHKIIDTQNDLSLKGKLQAIYRNAETLLELINQLLDFRKLEMGGEKLKLTENDFIRFIADIFVSFKETANNRNISFVLEKEMDNLLMSFDKSKMQKVFNNIYSNALKFTQNGGLVSTYLKLVEKNKREFLQIEISDTGCGIYENDLTRIFDRFYQSSDNDSGVAGSGIGLHLVKEYIDLHNGEIMAASHKGEGSTFTILIPTDLKNSIKDAHDDIQSVHEKDESHDLQIHTNIVAQTHDEDNLKKVLVVEDNAEFRAFLAEQLAEKFNIIIATDGEEGENLALHHSPDLIITDLMMPKVDGLELCRRIKSNIVTSHIPVILLTAHTTDEAQIESYRSGADSYISKPFNIDVLLVRMETLIEQQEKRKQFFRNAIEIQPENITISSLDEELIKKAVRSIEKNLINSDYSVVELCRDLGMSKSRLFPKFQSITGLTPNNFIRSVRLKHAAQLLNTSNYNISEISDRVGFNSIKYFNKYFKEEFGKTPSEYRKKA